MFAAVSFLSPLIEADITVCSSIITNFVLFANKRYQINFTVHQLYPVSKGLTQHLGISYTLGRIQPGKLLIKGQICLLLLPNVG